MKNLIKADIYKMLKGKSFFICVISCVVLSLISVFALNFYKDVAGSMQSSGIDATMNGAKVSLQNLSAFGQLKLAVGGGGNAPLIMAIFISIFAAGEFSSGTIKNTVSKSYSRVQIYLSKYVVAVAASLIMIIVSTIAFFIASFALWGAGTADGAFMADVLKTYGLAFLIYMTFVSLFIMISMIVRSTGGAVAVNICVIQFVAVFMTLIDLFLTNVLKVKFLLSDYLLTKNLNTVMSSPVTGELAVKIVVVSALVLVGSMAVGIFTFQKRDIK